MTKRFFAALIFLVMLFSACSAAKPDRLEQEAAKIEQALPEEYEKQSETRTYLFPFTNGEGGGFAYYLCETTYYAADPTTVTGLNEDAFRAVFDVDNTLRILEFDSGGHPAALYRGGERSYACCTANPQSSAVMVYDPEQMSDETAVKVISSIFETPDDLEAADP